MHNENIQMSILRSVDIRKSANIMGNTISDDNITKMETNVLDQNIRKSYMFQTANKNKNNIGKDGLVVSHQEIQENGKQSRRKIFESFRPLPEQPVDYNLVMSQTGSKIDQFSCCMSDNRIQVKVHLLENKQMIIKRAINSQILHNINFNTVQCILKQTQINSASFNLIVGGVYELKFQPGEQAKVDQFYKFKKNVDLALRESLGVKLQMRDIVSIPNFNKTKFAGVSEFAEKCETGDLLLFKSFHWAAKIQRFVTSSDYDHVAMLYRDPVHGILIFQSNSSTGVCLSPWESAIKYKWYNFMEEIVWRKLQGVTRDYDFYDNLQKLIIQHLGKEYNISLEKLLPANVSYVYKREPEQEKIEKIPVTKQQKEENRKKKNQIGFFCSELIAVILKDMKMLTRDEKNQHFKPSCNFYPYHFTQKFDPHLLKGSFSEEYHLHFNQKEIKEYYNFAQQ